MAHAENMISIAKPVSDVFNYVADGLNNPNWRHGVVSIELQSGQGGKVGTVYKQILKGPGGRNITGDYKITTCDTDKALSFIVITGPARPTGTYTFESIAEGTKLKFSLDFQPKGLARIMGPMIQKTMESEVSQLAMLKQVLENSGDS